MAQLLVWGLACAVLAWALRGRETLGACVVLVLWAAVPAVAAGRITGHEVGLLGMHPATWLTFALAGVSLLSDVRPLLVVARRFPYAVIATAGFVSGAIVTTALAGGGGVKLLGDQIVGPLLLFWLVVADARNDRARLLGLRNTIIGVATLESLLAILQYATKSLLVYTADFEDVYWFNPERLDRWMGTTDSPLVLSFLVCLATPLVVSLRHAWMQLGLVIVFMIGVVSTQSRVGLVVMVLVFLYLLVRARMSAPVRGVYALLGTGAAVALARSDFASGVTSRLPDDGSASARLRALQVFFDQFNSHLFTGEGLTSSYRVAQEAGLQTSFESSFMMYAVDTGVVLALLYFGAQVALVVSHARANLVRGAPVAASVGCLVQQTFSAVGFSNLCGVFIWATVALVVAGARPTHTTNLDVRTAPPVRQPVG